MDDPEIRKLVEQIQTAPSDQLLDLVERLNRLLMAECRETPVPETLPALSD